MKNFRGLERHICVFPKEVAFAVRQEARYVKAGYVREEKTLPDGHNGMWEGRMWGKRSKWHQGKTVRVPEQ